MSLHKLIFFCSFSFCTTFLLSQENVPYKGGNIAFLKDFSRNVEYPESELKHKKSKFYLLKIYVSCFGKVDSISNNIETNDIFFETLKKSIDSIKNNFLKSKKGCIIALPIYFLYEDGINDLYTIEITKFNTYNKSIYDYVVLFQDLYFLGGSRIR